MSQSGRLSACLNISLPFSLTEEGSPTRYLVRVRGVTCFGRRGGGRPVPAVWGGDFFGLAVTLAYYSSHWSSFFMLPPGPPGKLQNKCTVPVTKLPLSDMAINYSTDISI